MGRKIAAGNWKMNLTLTEAESFISEFSTGDWPADVEVIFAVPFPYLISLNALAGNRITIAAQNCSDQTEGAFTGEVSAKIALSAKIIFLV